MNKILPTTLYGNPLLRQIARKLPVNEIVSDNIQALIASMYYTMKQKKFGVGLAAPQVGESVAVIVVTIKPTPTRPNLEVYNRTLINPEIVKTFGKKTGKWEGCLSFGADKSDFPYGQAMRYEKVRVRYLDEKAEQHEETLDGFVANVVQHEVDHLNGILFVDRVEDNKTFMMASEFRKQILKDL